MARTVSDLPALPSADADVAHRRTRLHDHAVFDLGIAIVSGRLPEGEPLPEAELGKMLGVSRSVVREATKVLAAKGLLRSRPRVGTVPLPASHGTSSIPMCSVGCSTTDRSPPSSATSPRSD